MGIRSRLALVIGGVSRRKGNVSLANLRPDSRYVPSNTMAALLVQYNAFLVLNCPNNLDAIWTVVHDLHSLVEKTRQCTHSNKLTHSRLSWKMYGSI